jgi:hypothetical protein
MRHLLGEFRHDFDAVARVHQGKVGGERKQQISTAAGSQKKRRELPPAAH